MRGRGGGCSFGRRIDELTAGQRPRQFGAWLGQSREEASGRNDEDARRGKVAHECGGEIEGAGRRDWRRAKSDCKYNRKRGDSAARQPKLGPGKGAHVPSLLPCSSCVLL